MTNTASIELVGNLHQLRLTTPKPSIDNSGIEGMRYIAPSYPSIVQALEDLKSKPFNKREGGIPVQLIEILYGEGMVERIKELISSADPCSTLPQQPEGLVPLDEPAIFTVAIRALRTLDLCRKMPQLSHVVTGYASVMAYRKWIALNRVLYCSSWDKSGEQLKLKAYIDRIYSDLIRTGDTNSKIGSTGNATTEYVEPEETTKSGTKLWKRLVDVVNMRCGTIRKRDFKTFSRKELAGGKSLSKLCELTGALGPLLCLPKDYRTL